jgi:hypothetical protein
MNGTVALGNNPRCPQTTGKRAPDVKTQGREVVRRVARWS